jgi:AcrR family transcriptional regulator
MTLGWGDVPRKDRLTPKDWVLAGLAAMADGGIDAVRIERLALVLKTSKGSFYWHFADRPALLAAMLDFWHAEGTTAVIASLARVNDPAERLRMVTRIALETNSYGIDTAHAEAALRAWAAQDELVALRLQRVESARFGFLVDEGYRRPRAISMYQEFFTHNGS